MRTFTVIRKVRVDDDRSEMVSFAVRALSGADAIRFADAQKARIERERGFDTVASHRNDSALFHTMTIPTMGS